MSNKEKNVLDIEDDELDKKTSAYILDELEHISKYKANLEQTRYGDFHKLVVPYRELPPIVYVRDTLPTPPGDVQSGVLYVLKEENAKQYSAWIWDPTLGKYGRYVQVGDGDVGTVNWGNIEGNIEDQEDLNTILTDINNKINEINEKITNLQTLINETIERVSKLEIDYAELKTIVEQIEQRVSELETKANQFEQDISQLKVDVSTLLTDVSNIKEQIATIETTLANKQDKLIVGENITIDANNKISAKDTTYTAGEGISISEDNVISNTRVSAEWGNITGNINEQSDLIEKFNNISTAITNETNERKTADTNLQTQITNIQKLIPSEASESNQLADKNYVDTHIVDIELATETKIGGIYAAPYNSEEITSEVKIGEDGKLYNKQISMNVDNETLKIKLSN